VHRNMILRAIVVLGLSSTTVLPAMADEQMRPLAMAGTWIAMAHQPSMIAPPDVCLALDAATGVALWSNGEDVQLRVINSKWSLPTNVAGEVVVSIADWTATLGINDNTDTMISASMEEGQRDALLQAMDKGSSMSVKVGKAGPMKVSLSGSTKVTNAWRTCAGLKGSAGTPDTNPFK
jgi:hypothetical protein